MAIRVGGEGEMAVVVTARDEASAVVQNFAANSQASLAQAKQAGADTVKQVGDASKKVADETKAAAKEVTPVLGAWHNKAVAVGGAIGTAAAALATFAASATLFGLKRADEMNKLARQAQLSTETFTAMAHHMQLSDVNAQQFAAAMFNMERNLYKGGQTGKAFKETIETLGLDLNALLKLKPEEAFFAIADAVAKMEDPFAKAHALQQIFARGSRDMVDALSGGSAAIRRSMEEAAKLGGVIEGTTGVEADQFFDNLTKMGTALGSIGNVLAKGLSRDLVALSAALLKLIGDSQTLPALVKVLELLAKGLLFTLKVVLTGALAAQGVVTNLAKTVGGLGAAAAALIKGEFARAWDIVTELMHDLKANVEDTREAIGKLWGLIEEGPNRGRLQKQSGFIRMAFTPSDDDRQAMYEEQPYYFNRFGEYGHYHYEEKPGEDETYWMPHPGMAWKYGYGFRKAPEAGTEMYNYRRGPLDYWQEIEKEGWDPFHNWPGQTPEQDPSLIRTAQEEEMVALEAGFRLNREASESEHQQRMLDNWQRYYETRQQFVFKYENLNLQSMQFFFSQIGALMTVKSKALFNIGKAGAIAETIIQTYRAAQGAYAALAHIRVVGPALGAAAAAAALVAGFARVQAIRATQFGGAQGSPVLSSGGFSGPVTASGTGVAIPAPEGVAAAPPREVNITLHGTAFNSQTIRDELIPLLNDALGDGVRLNVLTP